MNDPDETVMEGLALPSPELLRELLRYEPETGKLFWRKRPVEMFASERSWKIWNTKFAGKEALTGGDGRGYLRGTILCRKYRAHRVIWAMETGAWPQGEIDHIDHDRANNKMKNLREVSRAENFLNQSQYGNNTSGVMGISWHKRDKKWQAYIAIDGRRIHLGYFDDLSSASAARTTAEIKYGFHKNHGAKALKDVGVCW